MNSKYLLLLIIALSSYSVHSNEVSSEISALLETGKIETKNKNYSSAIDAYKSAAELGSAKAYTQLSSIYGRGYGVDIDKNISAEYLQSAIKILQLSAKKGDIDAQYHLGYIYNRQSVNKNKSYKWLHSASTNGHMKAQFLFGYLLKKGFFKALVTDGYKESTIWFTKAAKQGHPKASYEIASRAYKDPKNFQNALKWCVPIAKKGDKKCQELVSVVAGRGIAFEKYKKISIDAITELAENNIENYQVSLGLILKDGKFIDKDLEKSNYWFTRAFNNLSIKAEADDSTSQYELAMLYKKGYGTDIDINQTKHWLEKSSQHGNKKAKQALTKLK